MPLGTFGNQPHINRQTFGTFGSGLAATFYDHTLSPGIEQTSRRALTLLGVAASPRVTASMWVKPRQTGIGASRAAIYFEGPAPGFANGEIDIDNTGRAATQWISPPSTLFDVGDPAHNQLILNAWNHIALSFDTTLGIGSFFVNGVDATGVLTPGINIDNTGATFPFSTSIENEVAGIDGSNTYDGCVTQVFMDTRFIDLTVAANLQKFRTAAGAPADLGTNGQNPFGAIPLIFMSDGKTNSGSGGAFTVNGNPSPCTTTPP